MFQIILDIFTMHAYTIDYHCYCYHYFTVCALQVTFFMVLSIQSTITGNSKVSAFFCFDWIQFSHVLTHSIFLVHSHFTSSLTFFFLLIQSVILGNSKVITVICFDWIQFSYNLIPSISLMHSHSYFKTHLHYSS